MSLLPDDYSDFAHEPGYFAPKFWAAIRDLALEQAERLGIERVRLEDELSTGATTLRFDRVGPQWLIGFEGRTDEGVALFPEELIAERMLRIGR